MSIMSWNITAGLLEIAFAKLPVYWAAAVSAHVQSLIVA